LNGISILTGGLVCIVLLKFKTSTTHFKLKLWQGQISSEFCYSQNKWRIHWNMCNNIFSITTIRYKAPLKDPLKCCLYNEHRMKHAEWKKIFYLYILLWYWIICRNNVYFKDWRTDKTPTIHTPFLSSMK
jgi:hypothetical protein